MPEKHSKSGENVPSVSRSWKLLESSLFVMQSWASESSKLREDCLSKKFQMFISSFPKSSCHYEIITAMPEVLSFCKSDPGAARLSGEPHPAPCFPKFGQEVLDGGQAISLVLQPH